jgi:outer membrane protein
MADSSRRRALGVGLGLGSLLAVVGRALGADNRDKNVRKADAQTPAAEPAPFPAPLVGTLDLDAAIKGYEKAKFVFDAINIEIQTKGRELSRLNDEGKDASAMLSKLNPGSEDARKIEDRITQIKAQLESGTRRAEREAQQRTADAMAALYKEVQDMTARVARQKRLTFVVRVSNTPVSGPSPEAITLTLGARPVVYADPRTDITADVVRHLNREYSAMQGRSSGANPR